MNTILTIPKLICHALCWLVSPTYRRVHLTTEPDGGDGLDYEADVTGLLP